MHKKLGVAALLAYIGVIVGSNFAVNAWGVRPIAFGLTAPVAVYFVGLAFTLRDLTHEALGRRAVLAAIAVGAGVSYAVGVIWPGNNPFVSPTRLAMASAIAFGLSELADLCVYEPLRHRGWTRAVVISNAVGLVVDSLIFLKVAFGSLTFLWGQVVGKGLMTAAAVIIIAVVKSDRREVVTA